MLIASLVIFLLVIFVVLVLVFRQIMNKNVVLATRHIEELSQDNAKKEDEINRRLEEVKQKSQEILSKGQEEAEKLKLQIIKQAEEESEKLMKEARGRSEEIIQQADKSREMLLAEINERIEKEAINRASALIQDILPEQFKQDVHLHWLKELMDTGFTKLERLHIPDGTQEIKITSAFSLDETQRKPLYKKLKDILGYEVKPKEEVDPSIVAGIIITIGSLVLDGSLKNKIQEKARGAKT